jgi:ribosomal protein S18 acetylase RimI-like enzyme
MIDLVPVRRDEIEKIAPMVREFWREVEEYSEYRSADEEQVENMKRLLYAAISRGEGVFWIIRKQQEIGFVEYVIRQHWSRPDVKVGRIAEIYIHPDHRRSGAGREAMNKILEEMSDDDVDQVIMSTSVRNEVSRRFWESLGFREDRIEMRRTLNS